MAILPLETTHMNIEAVPSVFPQSLALCVECIPVPPLLKLTLFITSLYGNN